MSLVTILKYYCVASHSQIVLENLSFLRSPIRKFLFMSRYIKRKGGTNFSLLILETYLQVNQGDTEIDVQLSIPVVTCNVVFEMAEFYDANIGATNAPDFVHCPRCSTSVAPNPGICSNCGENVFQCVKCRAINYDEKVHFLLILRFTEISLILI